MGQLISIEGGRSIKARDVQGVFASKSDDMSTAVENMAGFSITVWSDDGDMETVVFRGARCPYSPGMLADMIKKELDYQLGSGSAA